MHDLRPMRDLLAGALGWHDARVSFDRAVDDLEPGRRGIAPPGLPYSPWQLVEHIRRAQHDILEFCRNPDYTELEWPADYWPEAAAPPSERAWDESIAAVQRDRTALEALARDEAIDLMAPVPAGTGQSYLRELLLVIDHTAYHVGELVAVRRLLDAWPPS